RVRPRLASDDLALAVREECRVGLLVVPFVRVAGPGSIGVPHEEPCLDTLAPYAELLCENRSDGEVPVAIRTHADLAARWDREPTALVGSIAQRWRVDAVRDQPVRRALRIRGSKAACLRQLLRDPASRHRGHDPADGAAVADDVELTRVVLGKRRDG